ncbi:MAG TPA: phosphate ABC transporter permease subunit PstC [Mycobacteriales bacterium]|jgi:phosphate transport system permease protein|nr:phosphate ABC transporter permease subunit PstC [Mycobacteriales bacterium]
MTAEPISPTSGALRHRGGWWSGDRAFRTTTLACGGLVLAVLAAIALFLVVQALPAFRADSTSFWTTRTWQPDATPAVFGIAAVAFGSLLSSAIALLLAFPVAVGVALFITEMAPRRVANLLGYLTDALAAVPSVVFGLWGLYWLVPRLTPLQQWLADHLGFIPLFSAPQGVPSPSRSIFAVSIVLAIMILPIIAAMSRETIRQVDPQIKEAALGLGATRWEVVRTAVLPVSRAGLFGAVILGLGRALGETIAVALVLGISFDVNAHLLVPGKNTIAANIATQFGEAGSTGRAALIASGLVLFAMTMVVSLLARWMLGREARRRGASR